MKVCTMFGRSRVLQRRAQLADQGDAGGSPRAGRHRLVPRAGAGTWAIGRGALAICLPCAVPCEPVQPAHRLRAVGRTLCRSHRERMRLPRPRRKAR